MLKVFGLRIITERDWKKRNQEIINRVIKMNSAYAGQLDTLHQMKSFIHEENKKRMLETMMFNAEKDSKLNDKDYREFLDLMYETL